MIMSPEAKFPFFNLSLIFLSFKYQFRDFLGHIFEITTIVIAILKFIFSQLFCKKSCLLRYNVFILGIQLMSFRKGIQPKCFLGELLLQLVSVACSFSLVSRIPFCGCTTICWPFHLLPDIWIVFSFQTVIKMLWTLMLLCGQMFSLSWVNT